MDKSTIFTVLSALLLILLSSGALAFTVEAGSTGNVCAGTTIVVTDIIKGSGTFTVNTAGTAKPFSTVVPTGFSIEDGAQYLYAYITPSSRTTPGTYDLTVKINSGSEEKEVIHSITVDDCHASDLTITPQTLETCPCSPVTYTAILKNTGQYMESYQLSIEGPIKDKVILSDSVLNIDSNSNKTFSIYVNTSCDAGKSDFTVKAKATTSMTINEAKATLDIKPCYEYSIFLPQNYYSICEHESLDIPVTVMNEGTSINKILFNFKGPYWSSLTKSSLEVSPQTRGSVNITVKPGFRDVGNFTVSVDGMSEKGFVRKAAEAKINVETCYGVILNILNDKDKFCNGIANSYDFTIKNTGKFNNTYNLELKGPEWASISQNTIMLNAGEEITIAIKTDPSNTATAGTFTLNLKVIDPISNVQAADSIELSTVSIDDCYKSSVESDKEIIDVAPDSFTTAVLNIQNQGLRNASYIIDVSGTAAKYTQLNPGIVALEAGKAKSLYLYIAPPADTKEAVYDLTITTRLKDSTILSSKKLSVNVSKAAAPGVEIPQEENATAQPNFFVDFGNWFVEAFNTVTSAVGNFFSNLFTIKAPEINETAVTGSNETLNITIITNETIVQNETAAPSNETIITQTNETVAAGNETNVTVEGNATNETIIENIELGIIEVGNLTLINETESNETVNVTVTANETAAVNETAAENETLNVTITAEENITETAGNETQAPAFDLKNFLVENRAYVVGAIIVIFLIILFTTGLWKKIIDFFEEDEVVEKKEK